MTQLKKPFLGVAYYPEDWPEENLDGDIRKMKEIGINTVRIGEFAWHRMEPEPGVFDFSFFHRVCNRMKEAGIGVVLGTPTATPPVWLGRMYPEVFTEGENGRRSSHGGRRHCCSNQADYVRYCLRIVEKMGEEFGRDDAVIGWQLDNEIYPFGKGCFCPECVRGFRAYLKEKFDGIDRLNEAWGLNIFSQWYDSFDDVPAPRDAWHNPHLIMEWNLFQSQSHIRFIRQQAVVLHRYTDRPIGTDTMPINGIDYRDMTEYLDIVQFNHYDDPENLYQSCFWFDYLRTIKKAKFWNTETQTSWNGSTDIRQSMKPDGYCRVNSWLPIALGGEANMYWLWRTHWAGHELMHGAVLDTSGRPMMTAGEIRETARDFSMVSEFLTATEVETPVAIHFSSLAWHMHDAQHVVYGWEYMPTVEEHWYLPMANLGLRPDVIDAKQNLDHYQVIFTPMMMTLEEAGLATRMAEWVRRGGIWVIGPLTDVRTLDGTRYQDRYLGMLEELTGVRWEYGIPDQRGQIKATWADGKPFKGETWFEVYSEDPENALVNVTEGHQSIVGKSLLLERKVGKGRVIVLGTVPSESDMTRIIRLACEEAEVSIPSVKGHVMICPRTGKDVSGTVYVEFAGEPAEVRLEEPTVDLLTGQRYLGVLSLKPYGVSVLMKE